MIQQVLKTGRNDLLYNKKGAAAACEQSDLISEHLHSQQPLAAKRSRIRRIANIHLVRTAKEGLQWSDRKKCVLNDMPRETKERAEICLK